jgi:Holliday junction resolvase
MVNLPPPAKLYASLSPLLYKPRQSRSPYVNKEIGRRAEREIVKVLRGAGFHAVRIPTSNSSSNPLPDVFAVKGQTLLGIEVKSTWEGRVKVRGEQIRKVLDFLSMFPLRGVGLVMVKFKSRSEWRYVRVSEPIDLVVTLNESSPLQELLETA